jgi:ribosome maturation factor RimP
MSNPVQQAVAPRVEALAEPLARSLGLELVDVEYLREGPSWVLRIFIDKAPGVSAGATGGITLDDCTALSRALGPALDVDDVIGTTYSLEVSSPGLERPLKKPADFARFAGKRIKVKTYAPLPSAGGGAGPGQKNFQGVLSGFQDQHVVLEVDGKPLHIPLAAIAKAHLVVEL